MTPWNNAASPPILTCKCISASWVEVKSIAMYSCGCLNLDNPVSGKGLIFTIFEPFLFASLNAVSMRGWLVPGFCPTTIIKSLSLKSSK